jgi:hypothetical protein
MADAGTNEPDEEQSTAVRRHLRAMLAALVARIGGADREEKAPTLQSAGAGGLAETLKHASREGLEAGPYPEIAGNCGSAGHTLVKTRVCSIPKAKPSNSKRTP